MPTSRQIATHAIKEARAEQRDNRFVRGSSIGYCSRRIGYMVLGYEAAPTEAHGQLILDVGNALHDLLQDHLVRMGWIKAKKTLDEEGRIGWEQTSDPLSGCELEVWDPKLRLLGHLDGITVPLKKALPNEAGWEEGALYPDADGERYLIEIKTISDRESFWVLAMRNGGTGAISEEDCPAEYLEIDSEVRPSGKVQRRLFQYSHDRRVISQRFGPRMCPVYKAKVGGETELVTVLMIGNSLGAWSSLSGPKPEHIAQATLYAAHYDLKKILFLYLGKDVGGKTYDEEHLLNSPIKMFEHRVDPLDVAILRKKIETIYKATDREQLPPREFNPADETGECKWCPYRWQCAPDRYDLEEMNKQLEELGLKALSHGPGVTHPLPVR